MRYRITGLALSSSRSAEVRLKLSVVLPLLEIIRAQAARLASAHAGSDKHFENALTEVEVLLGLFQGKFSTSGKIVISEVKTPSVLRACSFLRLDLRQKELAKISDELMESAMDPKLYNGDEQRAVLCYAFLATLQEVLLKRLSCQPTLMTRLRSLFDKRAPANQPNDWQVIVLNDPVNLMTYVTAVFQTVLGLPLKAAEQRMREVHESKRSVVWTGPREKAESYVSELKSWHLTAMLTPNEEG